MTDVFVLRNQHNEYLNKSLEWISAGDSKTLYRTAHRDEVINQKVELTVKRPDLRIKAVAGEQASNGRVLMDGEDCLPKAQHVAPEAPTADSLFDTEAGPAEVNSAPLLNGAEETNSDVESTAHVSN